MKKRVLVLSIMAVMCVGSVAYAASNSGKPQTIKALNSDGIVQSKDGNVVIDSADLRTIKATINANAEYLENVSDSIGPSYSEQKKYAVGDIVTFNGITYKCKVAVTKPSAFTPANWTQISIGEVMNDSLAGTLVVDSWDETTGTLHLSSR